MQDPNLPPNLEDGDSIECVFHAPAQVCMSLMYFGKVSDGTHAMVKWKRPIDFEDEIHLSVRMGRPRSVELTCSRKDLENKGNWAWRAADLMLRRLKVDAEVKIAVWKEVPTGAGLGGGYSDAAWTLMALANLMKSRIGVDLDESHGLIPERPAITMFKFPMAVRNLFRIAYELGREVPPFIAGDSFFDVGQADHFSPIPRSSMPHCMLLLSDIEVSSAWAYEALFQHREAGLPCPAREAREKAMASGRPGDDEDPYDILAKSTYNDVETVVFAKHPALELDKRRLVELGARCAVLCGSGSAIVGIFDSEEAEATAMATLRSEGRNVRKINFKEDVGFFRPFVINLSGEPLPPELT